MIGRKTFYMTCVALFTVSSFLCGIAPSLGLLLFFRVLQGAGGGGLAPSEQAMLADTFPGKYFGQAFAIYGVAVVVAPAIGPALGGWITDNYSWRWIFFMNIPVGVLSLFLTYHLVQDPPAAVEATKRERAKGIRVDYIGFAFTVVAFGALQVVLDKGQEDDWFGSAFIMRLRRSDRGRPGRPDHLGDDGRRKPDRRSAVAGQRAISARRWCCNSSSGSFSTRTTVLIPQFVQQILGYNATNAGLILMPGGFALMFMMPIAGNLVGKFQPKYLMAIGLLLTAASMYWLTGFDTQVAFRNLAYVRVLQCIGLPLFFIPLNTIAYGNLPPGKSNNASAMMNLMRNLGGGIGISLATTLLTRRTQMHQRPDLPSNATRAFRPFVQLHELRRRVHAAEHPRLLQRRAVAGVMLSYLDVFKIFTIGTLLVISLVLMLRKVKPGTKAVAAH